MWYNTYMKTATTQTHYTLGRRAFAKVSAVEGIALSKKQSDTLSDYDRRGLSPAERRKAIMATFGKGR